MGKRSPAHDPNWQPPTPEERAQMLQATQKRREQYHREGKPWFRAGMTEEEYGHLLAFCAANPRLVQKLIVNAALAIEEKRAAENASQTH